jgi:magnesium and cobalt transporter
MSDDLPSSNDASGISGWWSRLFQSRGDEIKGREEIAAFLAESRKRELLGGDEFAMLQGVLEVSQTQVRDIMVPRSHMVVLEKDETPDALLKTIVESGHSRFPVIGEDRDEVVGILLAKDLLKHFGEDLKSIDIAELLRPAVFIPESKRLNTLLTEFRQSHNHIAIVVDEYGGVSGLATIEDVLEQIVGDIDDEHDPEAAAYIQDQGDGRYHVLALTRIEDFNEFFSANLSDEEYDTIGGLVMHELGRLPRRGEQLDFGGFRFRVLRGDRRRIQSVEVVRFVSDDERPAEG